MSKFLHKSVLVLVAMAPGMPIRADMVVRFEPAETFADFSLSGSSTPAVQDDLRKQLLKHLKQLAERYLPAGDELEIEIQDIDMAGAMEPWHAPNFTNTRFLRDVYPPRITLHYLWRDKAGLLKADRQEKLTDLNYLLLPDAARFNNNDPLRYEKAMLERWFRQTFGASNKAGDIGD